MITVCDVPKYTNYCELKHIGYSFIYEVQVQQNNYPGTLTQMET